MAKQNCPGQDTQFWKLDSIFELACVHCGKTIEFFKDDLRRRCPHCRQYMVNPKNDLACAAWCASAAQCLAQMGRTLPGDDDNSAEDSD